MRSIAVSLLLVVGALRAADLPSMPEAVSSFGAAVSGHFLYTYGGHKAEPHSWSLPSTSGRLHRLDLEKPDHWEELPSGPAVQSPGLAAYAGRIYCVGGMQPINADPSKPVLRSLSSASVFDPHTNAWSKLPDLPEPRSSHDMTILEDGRLFVLGGWALDTTHETGDVSSRTRVRPLHSTALVLDLNKPENGWQPIPQPFQRRALAVVACGGKIYALGGMDEKNHVSAAADVYDPTTGQWTTLPDIPGTGRLKAFAVAASVLGTELVASPASGEIFAFRSGTWQPIAHLQQPRYFHRLAAWRGHLLGLGGVNGSSPLNSVEELFIPIAATVGAQ